MADTFSRTGTFRPGYSTSQVDEFLTLAKESYADTESSDRTIDENAVRSVSFSFTRNGYEPELVDAALDRLERAFIQRRRASVVTDGGEQAWLESAYEHATSLYPRLRRPEGERFADAEGRGYDKVEVDELMGRIASYFDGTAELTSSEVRRATFSKAKGASAYDESVVDVFLDRAITVLLSVE